MAAAIQNGVLGQDTFSKPRIVQLTIIMADGTFRLVEYLSTATTKVGLPLHNFG